MQHEVQVSISQSLWDAAYIAPPMALTHNTSTPIAAFLLVIPLLATSGALLRSGRINKVARSISYTNWKAGDPE